MEQNNTAGPYYLPTELIELICEYCDDKSVLEYLPRAAKVFNSILANDKFWQRRCVIRIPKFIENDDDRSWKYRYQKNIQYFPDVPWSDYSNDSSGYGLVKDQLREGLLIPLKFPQFFGLRKRETVLLYGPPGPEKLQFIQAAATEAKVPLFRLRYSDLYRCRPGEGEIKLKKIFNDAKKHATSVLFIEEVDRIDTQNFEEVERETDLRIKTELFFQLGVYTKEMYIVGATDIPWTISIGTRRRFQRRLWVGLPPHDTRVKYFKQHLATFQHDVTDEEIADIAHQTSDYSAYDIFNVVREAALMPLRALADATHFKPATLPCTEDANHLQSCLTPCSPGDADGTPMNLKDIPPEKLYLPRITKRHLELALTTVKPTATKEDLAKFKEFTENYGSIL